MDAIRPAGGDSLEALEAYLYSTCKLTMEDRHRLIVDAVRPVLPQCLAEARRHPENPDAGRECVYRAISIVDDLWLALKPGWDPQGYHGRLWVHTEQLPDPAKFHDDHAIDKESVERCAAAYLAQPWLSSGYLDWVLLDALTRSEVVAFDFHVNGTKLDLSRLGVPKWLDWVARGGLSGPIEAVIAASVTWFLWHEYDSGAHYRNLWAGFAAAYYGLFAIRARREIRQRRIVVSEATAARAKIAKLIGTMKLCYRELHGPVLNPTRLREQFKTAETMGTGWSTATWPILENAISRNPGIWLTGRQQQPEM